MPNKNWKTSILQVFYMLTFVVRAICEEFPPLRCYQIQSDDLDLATDLPHESILMQPQYTHHRPSAVERYVQITRTPLNPETTRCDLNVTDISGLMPRPHLRSTCPWHYVLNTDMNRVPSTLIEAKCNCHGGASCVGGASNTRCIPIRYYIRVLRKYTHCLNDDNELEPVMKRVVEPIVVGCTCGVPVNHRHHHRH